MAKYNYNKSALKGLGVGAFLGEVKVREKHIAEAEATLPQSIFNANRLGAMLHPYFQAVVVEKVIDQPGAKTYILVPNEELGTKTLAYFRAGQYVSIELDINGVTLNKPYSLCSDPKAALLEKPYYAITVKRTASGFASDYILDNWTVGTKAITTGPLGNFYYTALRDAKSIVAVAGGSGITPFYAMAEAIASGVEDFDLTILYGSRTKDSIVLKDELDAVAQRANGKVKVVHVLSEEAAEGYEQGFITAELVKKYAPNGDYSVFLCGPKALYRFMDGELEKLNLKRRRIRKELSGEYGSPVADEKYPKDAVGKVFTLTVHCRGEIKKVPCKAEQSILQAMEFGGIRAPSDCRSGECGWCHSRLIAGDVYIPEGQDMRRMADVKFGWIHPCCTYALGDVELEIAIP